MALKKESMNETLGTSLQYDFFLIEAGTEQINAPEKSCFHKSESGKSPKLAAIALSML